MPHVGTTSDNSGYSTTDSLLTWRSGRPFSLLQDPGAEKQAGVAFGV